MRQESNFMNDLHKRTTNGLVREARQCVAVDCYTA